MATTEKTDTTADYLQSLNEPQRKAVEWLGGPSLVIAGAGSGKTRVLTYKIVHLLSRGYEPWRILALTFTNKAAREMRERIEALAGERTASRLWMGTFHSIFARILRVNAERIGYKSNFTIYDTADSRSLVKTIVKDMGLDEKIYKPAAVLGSISMAKNALISPEQYAADSDLTGADRRAKRPETYEIYRTYKQRCVVAGAMDFDDLLYYTNVLLRDNPDVLNHYREYFRYVLVDEYQDTNFAQHLIIRRLTEGQGNLCVVGDDAQSIYSFRGANISNILNLGKQFEGLKVFKLEQNYRSTQSILDAANTLISKNTRQIPKEVFTAGARGERVEAISAYSDYEEAFLVANRIARVKAHTGDPYNEFAILYRTNAQSRVLEESLRKRNIPYRIYGGLSFYQRKEVKDAIAYFRLAINPNDDEALRRVINFPQRGIGETTMAKLTRAAIDSGRSLWATAANLDEAPCGLNRGTITKVKNFTSMIAGFTEAVAAGGDAYSVASMIVQGTGMMSLYVSDTTPESVSRRENLEELLSAVKAFVSERLESGSDDMSLGAFMGEVSLATDVDTDDTAGDDRVTLMTVHAAKGLEFTNVFVVGVEEELFPSAMSSDTIEGVEEERRLLYVAITRARRLCMLSYAQSRFRNGQTVACSPSRFFKDIGQSNLKFIPGSDVTSAFESPRRQANPISNYCRNERRSTAPTPRPGTPAPALSMPGTMPAPQKSDKVGVLHTPDELRPGMTIVHGVFGTGEIVSIDTESASPRIVVNFNGPGAKVLLLKFAYFEIIN